ncbi:MAG: hypothetical protein MPJ50_02695 [Pirellulales bacterium]|nr:hypothetical protein [Pirellulales bacterium]
MPILEKEEYVEQAYFFHALAERITENMATQDVLAVVKQEILATAKLAMAIEFLSSELRLHGVFAPGMARLHHYFTPFQSYLIEEAENERGRFDFDLALLILEREAKFRAEGASVQGIFLFQYEVIAHNRLRYSRGLDAMQADPIFDASWQDFIKQFKTQIGLIELSDMIYIYSQHYRQVQQRQQKSCDDAPPPLFGEKEGKIALANRRRDPMLLFAALQRHLNYPQAPRPRRVTDATDKIPAMAKRIERLEMRLKLLEEEQKGGIDLERFYREAQSRAPRPVDE